jgi:hypothetical protein
MTLPTKPLDDDSLPVYLNKQLGIQLKGDAELHLHAGMPLRVNDQLRTSVIDASPAAIAMTTVTAAEIVILKAALSGRKVSLKDS